MIVGGMCPIREGEITRERAHDMALRSALRELADFVQVGRSYCFIIASETVAIGDPKLFDEYRILIRIEEQL